MTIIADTHVHSLRSGDGFSTLQELALAAKAMGLEYIALTDHACAMPGAPGIGYFSSMCASVPPELEGIGILRGVEADILDYEGALDITDDILVKMDWVIASMHRPVLAPGSREQHTAAWLAIACNPHVDVLGHCGNPLYEFDHEPVVRACAEHGKLIEINARSFTDRPGSDLVCAHIARLCAEYGVRVVASSDAHGVWQVGEVAPSLELLTKNGFPESLVLNADAGRFRAIVEEKRRSKSKSSTKNR